MFRQSLLIAALSLSLLGCGKNPEANKPAQEPIGTPLADRKSVV